MPKRKSKNSKKNINQVAGATPGTSGSMSVWRADLQAIIDSGLKAAETLGEAAAMTVELAVDGGIPMPKGVPGL